MPTKRCNLFSKVFGHFSECLGIRDEYGLDGMVICNLEPQICRLDAFQCHVWRANEPINDCRVVLAFLIGFLEAAHRGCVGVEKISSIRQEGCLAENSLTIPETLDRSCGRILSGTSAGSSRPQEPRNCSVQTHAVRLP
jgi:hypothetical protein